jgi:DNA-binding response OmpR family regulator
MNAGPSRIIARPVNGAGRNQSAQETVPTRTILVAEDFGPFREFICDRLSERSDVAVVSVADGVSAVRAAEELQPALALLDIGLPMLNGIAAAKDIRASCPQSKVVFLTQESSPDVVDAARELGAHGYVHKTRAHYLMPIVDALLGVAPPANVGAGHGDGRHASRHEVHVFGDDSVLADSAERFVVSTLGAGDGAIVALTRPHLDALEARLRRHHAAVDDARAKGRFVTLDAGEVLPMVTGDRPDVDAVETTWRDLISAVGAATGAPPRRVGAFSEIAPHVLAAGHTEVAMTLEQVGEDLCSAPDLPVLDIGCVYTALPSRDEFKRLCSTHALVTIR